VPAIGGFIIYTIMVAVLIFRPQGLFGRVTGR
jgi:branched-chain amino acid transport system permease protein